MICYKVFNSHFFVSWANFTETVLVNLPMRYFITCRKFDKNLFWSFLILQSEKQSMEIFGGCADIAVVLLCIVADPGMRQGPERPLTHVRDPAEQHLRIVKRGGAPKAYGGRCE